MRLIGVGTINRFSLPEHETSEKYLIRNRPGRHHEEEMNKKKIIIIKKSIIIILIIIIMII